MIPCLFNLIRTPRSTLRRDSLCDVIRTPRHGRVRTLFRVSLCGVICAARRTLRRGSLCDVICAARRTLFRDSIRGVIRTARRTLFRVSLCDVIRTPRHRRVRTLRRLLHVVVEFVLHFRFTL